LRAAWNGNVRGNDEDPPPLPRYSVGEGVGEGAGGVEVLMIAKSKAFLLQSHPHPDPLPRSTAGEGIRSLRRPRRRCYARQRHATRCNAMQHFSRSEKTNPRRGVMPGNVRKCPVVPRAPRGVQKEPTAPNRRASGADPCNAMQRHATWCNAMQRFWRFGKTNPPRDIAVEFRGRAYRFRSQAIRRERGREMEKRTRFLLNFRPVSGIWEFTGANP